MKKLGKVKAVDAVFLTTFLLIVLSTFINVIVNLITENDKSMFLFSVALIIQFTSKFINNHNPFEIVVVVFLMGIIICNLLALFKSYNYKNKCFYTGVVSVSSLLFSVILPILLGSDFIGHPKSTLTYNDELSSFISCILFGLFFSAFSSTLSLIQLLRYTKYLDEKYTNPNLAVLDFKKVYYKNYYSSLKKPLLLPSVYATIPLILCSFLIYFNVNSIFLICFIYFGFGIGLVYHIICNLSGYKKLKTQERRNYNKDYNKKLFFTYLILMLCYCLSLFLLLMSLTI